MYNQHNNHVTIYKVKHLIASVVALSKLLKKKKKEDESMCTLQFLEHCTTFNAVNTHSKKKAKSTV